LVLSERLLRETVGQMFIGVLFFVYGRGFQVETTYVQMPKRCYLLSFDM